MPARFAALSPRTVLRLDGVLCLVMGGALLALQSVLAAPLGLPPGFLAGAGVLLLLVGLFIVAVSWPASPSRLGVAIVVIGNVLWVVASIGVILVGVVEPTSLGVALILAQAAAVAVIAALEALPALPRQANA